MDTISGGSNTGWCPVLAPPWAASRLTVRMLPRPGLSTCNTFPAGSRPPAPSPLTVPTSDLGFFSFNKLNIYVVHFYVCMFAIIMITGLMGCGYIYVAHLIFYALSLPHSSSCSSSHLQKISLLPDIHLLFTFQFIYFMGFSMRRIHAALKNVIWFISLNMVLRCDCFPRNDSSFPYSRVVLYCA